MQAIAITCVIEECMLLETLFGYVVCSLQGLRNLAKTKDPVISLMRAAEVGKRMESGTSSSSSDDESESESSSAS